VKRGQHRRHRREKGEFVKKIENRNREASASGAGRIDAGTLPQRRTTNTDIGKK